MMLTRIERLEHLFRDQAVNLTVNMGPGWV